MPRVDRRAHVTMLPNFKKKQLMKIWSHFLFTLDMKESLNRKQLGRLYACTYPVDFYASIKKHSASNPQHSRNFILKHVPRRSQGWVSGLEPSFPVTKLYDLKTCLNSAWKCQLTKAHPHPLPIYDVYSTFSNDKTIHGDHLFLTGVFTGIFSAGFQGGHLHVDQTFALASIFYHQSNSSSMHRSHAITH